MADSETKPNQEFSPGERRIFGSLASLMMGYLSYLMWRVVWETGSFNDPFSILFVPVFLAFILAAAGLSWLSLFCLWNAWKP